MEELRPFLNVSTGDVLKDDLEALGWTQEDFAQVLGMSVKAVNEILNGKVALTVETAQLIGRALGTSAQMWLNIDAKYRLRLLEESEREKETERQASVRRFMPVREMQKRAWLPPADSGSELVEAARKFWELKEPDFKYLETAVEPAYRRTRSRETFEKYYALTWAQKARLEARRLTLPLHRSEALESIGETLADRTREENGLEAVVATLNEAGVGFLVLSHLPKTYLDGAALFVGSHPFIVYTGRYDRLDHFWFTLAHELAHLALGHARADGDGILDEMRDTAGNQQETEADALAARWLYHDRVLKFCEPFHQYLSRTRVEACAEAVGVHPALVVGTLQHHQLLSYKNLNDLKPSVLDRLEHWKVG
jgi:HTH-type transcriptional regulator/antitoxin HigA